jgi:hypothetical protein
MARAASGPIVSMCGMRDLDLASIVLANPGRRRSLAPERMPLEPETHGFDARSALVLALVVATMAGVVGWATMGGVAKPNAPVARSAGASKADVAATTNAPAADETLPFADAAKPVAPAAPKGVDLAPARVVALKSGNGGGIIRVGIANQGRDALGASGAAVLVLMDGEQVGEDTIGGIDATSSTTTELALGYCPSGSHSLVVIVDPRGQVREADERDNARTQTVAFGC